MCISQKVNLYFDEPLNPTNMAENIRILVSDLGYKYLKFSETKIILTYLSRYGISIATFCHGTQSFGAHLPPASTFV